MKGGKKRQKKTKGKKGERKTTKERMCDRQQKRADQLAVLVDRKQSSLVL